MLETVIGLEIHVQPKTKSKMFCSCDAQYFGDKPNTHTCPVCLGLPGALPVPNIVSIRKCVKVGLALNCNINKESKFDRKHYFYPDLPKAFQLSQYDIPFAEDGELVIKVNDKNVKIGITRVHQEEDTGKSSHSGKETLLDFNKSGVPLIEIVTEPDFKTVDEVSQFAKRLRQIIRYIEVGDADMEKGQMRFELNISLREEGETELPNYKVEVKNIASISVLEKVIEFEVARQKELLESGEIPVQETRGVKDMSGVTLSQRIKEGSADYRYFPEPDIPPIVFEQSEVDEIQLSIVELLFAKKERYMSDYGLSNEVSENIVSEVVKYKEFEVLIENLKDNNLVLEIAKLYIGDYAAFENNEDRNDKFDIVWLKDLVTKLLEKKITRNMMQTILKESYTTGISPEEIIKRDGLELEEDSGVLDGAIKAVIEANPKAVEDYKKNPNSVMYLVGQVMKEMKGKADAKDVKEMLEKAL